MRKPSEMYTALRMQNMMQICKENAYFMTNLPIEFFEEVLLDVVVESPHGGAIYYHDITNTLPQCHQLSSTT